MKSLSLQLGKGDALIILPPFAPLEMPSLGVHILQSCGRKAGFEVKVLYANIAFAAEIGESNYQALNRNLTVDLLGEKIFSLAAYGPTQSGSSSFASHSNDIEMAMNLAELKQIAASWTDSLSEAIVACDFNVIGCSTTFDQTASSMALQNGIKRRRPEIVTIIGGTNCENEMAEGILTLCTATDYVFSGESEESFPRFLRDIREDRRPSDRIIHGRPCMNLEEIPTPEFSEYYTQMASWLPDSEVYASEDVWLPYESSRGCWWGQKHHCTFCGIERDKMKFRQKSANRVIEDLKKLLAVHPTKKVAMSDSIMPYDFFKTLMPRLRQELPGAHIFYEIRANISLEDVMSLRDGGIGIVQSGIESLSTSCLKLMNKGTTARQNIALLRYLRSADLAVEWNLLYSIPGDRIEEYANMLIIFPLLRHLHPPTGMIPIYIERFCSYFEQPEKYGIRNLRPRDVYSDILPEDADIAKIAYYFEADYESESRDNIEVMGGLKDEIERWRSSWQLNAAPPALVITELGDDRFLMLDSRRLPGAQELTILSYDQARVALAGPGPRSRNELAWAIEKKLVLELDRRHVPLATARPDLLSKFEAELRNPQKQE
jgi:ribosomal peptide maturation radical SAM protein 1